MVDKAMELFAQMDYVAANMVGVVTLILIVELVVKAGVNRLQNRHRVLVVVGEMLEGLFLLYLFDQMLKIQK